MGFIMDNRWHHFVVQLVKDAFWKVFLTRITQGFCAYIYMHKEWHEISLEIQNEYCILPSLNDELPKVYSVHRS